MGIERERGGGAVVVRRKEPVSEYGRPVQSSGGRFHTRGGSLRLEFDAVRAM